MSWPLIKKSLPSAPRPNLQNYEQTRAAFSWEMARRALSGLPDGRGLNMAHEAVDRHARGQRGSQVALRWLGKEGLVLDFTFSKLQEETNRFANVLGRLGVSKGDRVFVLAGRIPELYIAALGTLKHRGVFCPLFSAFGPEPIRTRLAMAQARVLVATEGLYQRKVAGLRTSLPCLEHVLIVGDDRGPTDLPGTLGLTRLMSDANPEYAIEPTDPEDMALLHFTSGTTGAPKGAIHVHQAVLAHRVTGKLALDLHPDGVFWCTADPGWVTGTSYGILAPLTNGVTSIIDEADFDAARWYRILQEQKVTVWYTAPTAIRMLMKTGPELARQLGVDAGKVQGTGPGGAITREDIERAAGSQKSEAAPPAPPTSGRRLPTSDARARMRQAIAAAMARSKREIPHYYLSTTIDMQKAMSWLTAQNEKRPITERLLPGVLLVKATARALRKVPRSRRSPVAGARTTMTRDNIRATVLRLLTDRAREIDPAQLRPDRPLRDQIDLDSMDYLNFLIALHKAFGTEIPEKDYPQLATLDGCIEYLAAKVE